MTTSSERAVEKSFSNNELLNQQIQFLRVQQSELKSLGDDKKVYCKMGNIFLPTTRESLQQVVNYKLKTIQQGTDAQPSN
ncbi:Uncharacterized protein QTN25_005607 [Entamoeba marina]